MHTDPIADMLTRIRNAQAVGKKTARVKLSKYNAAILEILKKNNYIQDMKINDANKEVEVTLIYENKKPKMKSIKRISMPGQKRYVDVQNIPCVLNGFGIAIISTSKGLMTDKQAIDQKIGGEVICEIY